MRAAALLLACAACTTAPRTTPGPAAATDPAASSPANTAAAPPAASPPTAAADASASANAADVLDCVLAARAVQQYVHPELPERVPVRVHLPADVTLARVPEAFGAPIEVVTPDRALLQVHALRLDGGHAEVVLGIAAEGVAGEVACDRDGASWAATRVALREH